MPDPDANTGNSTVLAPSLSNIQTQVPTQCMTLSQVSCATQSVNLLDQMS